MTHVAAALAMVSLSTIFIFNIYILLRYLIVADALRKILNRSSGDGKRSGLRYPATFR